MYTILLLTISNIFMTYAWYGHLKHLKESPIWIAILASWGVALLEYMFMVPANRIGATRENYSLFELKILQECITLAVFTLFAVFMFKQGFKWNYFVSYLCLIAAVYFAFFK